MLQQEHRAKTFDKTFADGFSSLTFHPSLTDDKNFTQSTRKKFASYFKTNTRPTFEWNLKGNRRRNRASRNEAYVCTKGEETSAIENKNLIQCFEFSSAASWNCTVMEITYMTVDFLHNNRLIDAVIIYYCYELLWFINEVRLIAYGLLMSIEYISLSKANN